MAAPPQETIALAAALGGAYSPELLFEIGGGTGFGWFTYGDHSTLLTRITTRETQRESFLLDICERLGVDTRLAAASSSPALRKQIEKALASGDQAVVLIGGPGMSYSAALVDSVTDDLLAKAAALPGASRNRFLAIHGLPGKSATARREAIRAGLRAHIQQMKEGFGPPSTRGSFGLAGFERWRRSAPSLDSRAHERLREQIAARGGGPALRLAQAAFLDEAWLKQAARLTRHAADAWLAAAVEPTVGQITAVEKVEREALQAIEGSSIV